MNRDLPDARLSRASFRTGHRSKPERVLLQAQLQSFRQQTAERLNQNAFGVNRKFMNFQTAAIHYCAPPQASARERQEIPFWPNDSYTAFVRARVIPMHCGMIDLSHDQMGIAGALSRAEQIRQSMIRGTEPDPDSR